LFYDAKRSGFVYLKAVGSQKKPSSAFAIKSSQLNNTIKLVKHKKTTFKSLRHPQNRRELNSKLLPEGFHFHYTLNAEFPELFYSIAKQDKVFCINVAYFKVNKGISFIEVIQVYYFIFLKC